jgi:hypothetical protein
VQSGLLVGEYLERFVSHFLSHKKLFPALRWGPLHSNSFELRLRVSAARAAGRTENRLG